MTADASGPDLARLAAAFAEGAQLHVTFRADAQRSGLSSDLEAVGELLASAPGVTFQRGDVVGAAGHPVLSIAAPDGRRVLYMARPHGPEASPFEEAVLGLLRPSTRSEEDRADAAGDSAEILVFVAAACPHCPEAARAANRLALDDPSVTTAIVDAQEFADLAERHAVRSVPATLVDRILTLTGVTPVETLQAHVASRGGPAFRSRALASLVEVGRFPDALELIQGEDGPAAFAEAWRTSTTSTRIGLMLLVEQALEADRAALDRAVEPLLVSCDADDAALRGDTADVLMQIGHVDARATLERLRNDPNPDVAEIAQEALDEIAGRDDD